MEKYQIHKAAGIIIQDGKQLLVRSKGKEHFVEPGGKLEAGEMSKQALVRELKEELDIDVLEDNLEIFGTFYAPAAGKEDLMLRMDVFRVNKWTGQITPSSEIEEDLWVGATVPANVQVGSIFEHDINPRLVKNGLVK